MREELRYSNGGELVVFALFSRSGVPLTRTRSVQNPYFRTKFFLALLLNFDVKGHEGQK